MGSRKRTTKQAASKPSADSPDSPPPPPAAPPMRWLDFIPENWDAINSRQAYYLAGRIWRRYQFHCQQWVICSYRPNSSDTRLEQHLPDLHLLVVVGTLGFHLFTPPFDPDAVSGLRLALRQAIDRMSPRFGLGIRTRVDALIDRYFPNRKLWEPNPWRRELEDAVDRLQQAVARGESEKARELLAEENYDRLVEKFVFRRFAKLSEELLRGATKSAAALFHLGDQLEKAFCPRKIFAHVRTSRLMRNRQRRWKDVVLADRWLSPADIPPSKGWPHNIKTQLQRAGLWSQEVQAQVAECETAVIGEQAHVTELVKQLHELLMASLAPAAVTPAPSDQSEDAVESESLGLRLVRRRRDKSKKYAYELFVTHGNKRPLEPAPQAGGMLWLLIEAEKETGKCRLTLENVEEYLRSTQNPDEVCKTDLTDRRRSAIGRLNSFFKGKKLNLTANGSAVDDEGDPHYLEISKANSAD